jgi:hypothetical protein
MDKLVAALVVVIPVVVVASIFRLLSVEHALGIVWAAVLAAIALGLVLTIRLADADASR